jgi:NAD+ synthase
MTITEELELKNPKETIQKITTFIKEIANEAASDGVIIGLSGGIDSSVTASLAVKALGEKNVLGLILPTASLDKNYEKDAQQLAKQLSIKVEKISIEKIISAFIESLPDKIINDKLVVGNAMARVRMMILYAYANKLNYLVIGTSNKTEIMVGYITKYGDGGVDFEPCGDLYKTQMIQLARMLKVPKAIIEKPPSAGFWKGQTDEGEMGITYELLDKILVGIMQKLSEDEIMEKLNCSKAQIEKVKQMIRSSSHKRTMPKICILK